jgi:hypothetical protein
VRDTIYDFDDVANAHRCVDTGHEVGDVVERIPA